MNRTIKTIMMLGSFVCLTSCSYINAFLEKEYEPGEFQNLIAKAELGNPGYVKAVITGYNSGTKLEETYVWSEDASAWVADAESTSSYSAYLANLADVSLTLGVASALVDSSKTTCKYNQLMGYYTVETTSKFKFDGVTYTETAFLKYDKDGCPTNGTDKLQSSNNSTSRALEWSVAYYK